MILARAKLRSTSPYSQSKPYNTEKRDKESADAYEKRTWSGRAHADENGECFIPPMQFKNSIAEAARYLSRQIPGKGKATYTKHFEAGIVVFDALKLGVNIADVKGEWLYVPSDGRRGGGTRVWKCFPYFPEWSGTVEFMILDETITREEFKYTLEQCGQLIGIGRWRPRNNGLYGRFSVEDIEFEQN